MRILTLATFALTFLLTGCDTVVEPHQRAIRSRAAQDAHYPVEQKIVFEGGAAGGPNNRLPAFARSRRQGIVDGISRIQSGDSLRDARQHSIEVRLHAYEPGTTQVDVLGP